jgi:hypothetical protein
MEAQRFDSFARLLGRPAGRRRLLFGLALSPLTGLVAARHVDDVDAKKRHKHKHKKRHPKAQPNAFGCFEVDDPCTSAAECCSGICDDKTCRAHDTGTCRQVEQPELCLASIDEALLVLCDNSQSCGCYRTTSDSLYCSAFLLNEGDPRCADCQTDADCVALGYPPEAACAPVAQGRCAGACPSGMACLVPCGVELPDPAG